MDKFRIQSENMPGRLPQIAAVDSNNSIGIERKENINKIRFLYKNIFNAIYFDVIS